MLKPSDRGRPPSVRQKILVLIPHLKSKVLGLEFEERPRYIFKKSNTRETLKNTGRLPKIL